jgi:8-hydroxy-5-deazaflavin:NADPH oxidoreductase
MTAAPAIGVLGSGPMGRGFAMLLSRAGYAVTLGTRHPEAPELTELPVAVRISSFPEAATRDIAFIAVAHSAARDLVTSLARHLAGKTLISCLNAWIPADYAAAGLSSSVTEGSWMARLIPDASVARAFSHIDQRYLVTKATTEPGKWAVSYATDDITSAVTVEDLIRAMGYVPYLIGTLAESAPLDYDGVLSHRLLTPEQMRTTLNHTEPAGNLARSNRKERPCSRSAAQS